MKTLLTLVVAVLMLGGAPASSRAQTTFTQSFIDVNNDGTWNAGDLPLADYLGPDSYGFNALQPQPGYQPTGRPVGLVVQGTLYLRDLWLVQLLLTGDVRINGNITVITAETTLDIMTTAGDITIAPLVSINGNGNVAFRTFEGGDIRLGAGSRYSTRGDFWDVSFDADGIVTVETGVQFQLKGGGYKTVIVHGRDGVAIAPGVTMRGPAHGGIQVLAGADITLSRFNAKCGYIHVEAYGSDRHPAAKRLTILDSSLSQTYVNGDFRLIAGGDYRNGSFYEDGLVLERTYIRTKEPTPLYVPIPVIR